MNEETISEAIEQIDESTYDGKKLKYYLTYHQRSEPEVREAYWSERTGDQYISDETEILNPKRDALVTIIRNRWDEEFGTEHDWQYCSN